MNALADKNTNRAKITTIAVGFLNIGLGILELLLMGYQVIAGGLLDISDRMVLLYLLFQLFVLPVIWLCVCGFILLRYIQYKQNRRLTLSILLGTLLLDTLYRVLAVDQYVANYSICFIIRVLTIGVFILAIVCRDKNKWINLSIVYTFAAYLVYTSICVGLRIRLRLPNIGMWVILFEIVKPLLLMLTMYLFLVDDYVTELREEKHGSPSPLG